MKVHLTRDVKVRTITGLIPFSKLRVGDSVIACDSDNNMCIDTVTDIIAAAVIDTAQMFGANGDKALVELREQPTIGTETPGFDLGNNRIVESKIGSVHPVKYDDIAFKVCTKEHHRLIIGDKGAIVVEVD